MQVRPTILALIFLPGAALADCPGLTVLSCTLSGGAKTLQVCQSGDALTYAFGKTGRSPDLTLTEPLANGTYTPWNGIGRAMWETTAFHNDGYTYETWASLDRLSENAQLEGGINILQGDAQQAELLCDAGTVTAHFDQLFPVMEAQGYCWNRENFGWQPQPCD